MSGQPGDVSMLGAVQAQAQDTAALLAAIVSSSFDPIVSKTLDGTVTSWNEAVAQLFGYREEEMLGQSIRRIIPPDRQQEEDYFLDRIAAGERIHSLRLPGFTKTAVRLTSR